MHTNLGCFNVVAMFFRVFLDVEGEEEEEEEEHS